LSPTIRRNPVGHERTACRRTRDPCLGRRGQRTPAASRTRVETDVVGLDLDEITDQQRAEVTAAHPRPDFKNKIIRAFYNGMADRPETTFGTMNDDVLAHFDPSF
jgi:hypothetical protein